MHTTIALSPTELEALQTLLPHSIEKLESMAKEVNEALDNPANFEEYDMYLGCLTNVLRDTGSLRSILQRLQAGVE